MGPLVFVRIKGIHRASFPDTTDRRRFYRMRAVISQYTNSKFEVWNQRDFVILKQTELKELVLLYVTKAHKAPAELEWEWEREPTTLCVRFGIFNAFQRSIFSCCFLRPAFVVLPSG